MNTNTNVPLLFAKRSYVLGKISFWKKFQYYMEWFKERIIDLISSNSSNKWAK